MTNQKSSFALREGVEDSDPVLRFIFTRRASPGAAWCGLVSPPPEEWPAALFGEHIQAWPASRGSLFHQGFLVKVSRLIIAAEILCAGLYRGKRRDDADLELDPRGFVAVFLRDHTHSIARRLTCAD